VAVTDQARSGTVPASGTVDLVFTPTAGQNWVVRQVSIDAANVGGSASCALYRDSNFISPLVPQGDAAVEPPPINVNNGHRLIVRWTAGTVGATVNAFIIYDDGQG
jgi:hypothetical protein